MAALVRGVLDTSIVIFTTASTLPDEAVARSYGALAHSVAAAGGKPRTRTMDILVAATAHAHGVAVYIKNLGDFESFRQTVDVYQT